MYPKCDQAPEEFGDYGGFSALWRYALILFVLSTWQGQAQGAIVKDFQKLSPVFGLFQRNGGDVRDGDDFGESIDTIGDLDGDGVVDLVIGAQRDDDGGAERGAVYIAFLNPDGTVRETQKISDTQGNFTGTLDNGDTFGIAATGLGDLDGDGVLDIAVGASRDDDGGSNTGAVWVLFLNTDGTVKAHQKISDTQGGLNGALPRGIGFGGDLEMLGDFDGDGNGDLFVTRSGNSFYIVYLNSNGTVKSFERYQQGSSGGFGQTGALAGDIDGDGQQDLAVGAQFDDDGGTNRGAVWILFMNSDGSVRERVKISSTRGGFGGLLENDDQFGQSVSTVGDLNRDGTPDLVVGAEHADSPDGSILRTGEVWILYLRPDGTVLDEQLIRSNTPNFTALLDENNFGQSVTFLGDLDGDGIGDIAVGADGDFDLGRDAGAAYVIFLKPSNPAEPMGNSAPSVASPGRQTSFVGDSVSLQVVASDSDAGDVIVYSASQLPEGLTIDSSSGLISGTLTSASRLRTTVTVTDNNGWIDNATFSWDVSDGFFQLAELGGGNAVVMEAESYQSSIARGVRKWRQVVESGASGGTAMLADPELATIFAEDYEVDSPRLDFPIAFPSSGTYYLWVRGFSEDTGSNSVHVGLDNIPQVGGQRLEGFELGQWSWSNRYQTPSGGLAVAVIEVDSAGPHTLNVWIREDGFELDKVLLTSDLSFIPSGLGPEESPRDSSSNNAPLIAPIADQNSSVGELLSLAISASDFDGPAPLVLEVDAPFGALFTDFGGGSGELMWTPSSADLAGSPYTVVVRATDDGGLGVSAERSFLITVTEGVLNREPELTNPGAQSGLVGDSVSLLIEATDADLDDELSFDSAGLPTGLVINEDTGEISGSLTAEGTFNANVTVSDGNGGEDDVSFEWVVSDPEGSQFQQSPGVGNILSVEAENASLTLARGNQRWERVSASLASGGLAMEARPDSGINNAENYVLASPRLDFVANFVASGTHYVWVLGFGKNLGGDSVHLGLDGVGQTGSKRVDVFPTGAWSWSNQIQVSPGVLQVATVEVDAPGTHVLNVWMREDGFRVDKVVLSTDPSFVPTGFGPTESPLGGGATGNVPPQLTNPGAQTGLVGDTVSLMVEATDVNAGDELSFIGTGLPTGLLIDEDTGEISGVLEEVGVFTAEVTVSDGSGAEASESFEWLVSESGGLVFQQSPASGNLLSFEAESATSNLARNGQQWEQVGSGSASGSLAMEARPDLGTNNADNYVVTSPRLDYTAEFVASGTHYVWVRGFGKNLGGDSVHVGLDGIGQSTSKRVDVFPTGTWSWSNQIQVGPGILQVATIEVDAPGIHTLNVWMREDGFRIDKIVLTTDASFVPNGLGPTESPLGGGVTGNARPQLTSPGAQTGLVDDIVNLSIEATDADLGDELRFAASGLPTGLSIDANSGEISGTLEAAGSFTVSISVLDGNGGQDNAVFEWSVLDGSVFQQSMASGNVLSIEAENSTSSLVQGANRWEQRTVSDASGGLAMEALPDNGTNNSDSYVGTSPRLDYAANFVASGTHYVWVRGFGKNLGGDSVHVGLDGVGQASSRRVDAFPEQSWSWSNQIQVSPGVLQIATIEVDSPGVHTLNVWMREDGFRIDKIVLTTDPSFVPVGFGPLESLRE
ncbi:MAG: putative Ig domain-containing protein [Pseudomonadota bacterium]